MADLSHVLTPDFPVWPGFAPLQIDRIETYGERGFAANALHVCEHTGTHIDAPVHFVDGAAAVDEIDATNLVASIAVIDIREKAHHDADAVVTRADIERWEIAHGPIPGGAAVLMYSGWESRLADGARAYLNEDDAGVLHFPAFSGDAAEFLVRERSIKGIGVDTLSIDPGNAAKPVAHVAVLGAGCWALENLANLRALPACGATLIIGCAKFAGCTGAPARCFAFW